MVKKKNDTNIQLYMSWTKNKGFLFFKFLGLPIFPAQVASRNTEFVPLRSLSQPCNL